MVVFFAGEMLPKSIAKKYAERLAMRTARSLRFFMVLFNPLSALLTAFGNAVARRVQSEPAVTVTEDELADIIENMTDDGELTRRARRAHELGPVVCRRAGRERHHGARGRRRRGRG